ncbi:MAG: thiol:disulfide interchange protein [Halobacteriovoraceae bacterium]|nr:thiol:disulfide interchange protein [Halobacteriovoraceae bacterium]
MMKNLNKFFVIVGCLGLVSCMSDSQLKDKMTKILKENPQIVVDSIKENPADYIVAIQEAAKNAQGAIAKKKQEEEKKKLEATYDNPLKPVIRADEAIRGNKNAPLTLVEYSDFECPFCSRGFNTVMELIQKYGDNIRFVYKHLPLSFHKQAMISSQYYEALRVQNHELAFKFHDEIYKNQSKLKTGEKFLKSVAKKLGADMAKLKKDVKSKAIQDRIDADLKEAAKFGMQGTPGFILNGIPVKGAYPTSHFVGIVDELKKRGKVKL